MSNKHTYLVYELVIVASFFCRRLHCSMAYKLGGHSALPTVFKNRAFYS